MVNDDGRRAHARARVQAYARIAGVLLVLSYIAGGFGEAYVPSRLIVPADAAATAENIRALHSLFRMGFAGYLVEATCDIALSLILYQLLRPVRRDVALLSAFFGLVGTAVYAVAELAYFAASHIVGGAAYLNTFSPDQLNTLAFLALKLFGYGGGLFLVFGGVAWILRGYLIFQSGYLPRIIGVLLALGGLAFVARNFALVLAPAYPSGGLLLLALPGGLALAVWLLVKGVDLPAWEARA
jgi:hypothetical protein